jgi:hypothetical protein
MNGLVAAPLQFCADRRFAGAGNAFNQIISPALGSMMALSLVYIPSTVTESCVAAVIWNDTIS